MRPAWVFVSVALAVTAACQAAPTTLDQRLQNALTFSGSNLINTANSMLLSGTQFPCYAEPGQAWETRPSSDWGSGMFGGSFWILAKLTGNTAYVPYAQTWSGRVNSGTTGLAWDAYKTWYDYNGNTAARNIVIAAAVQEKGNYVALRDASGQNLGSRGVISATGWRPNNYPAPTYAGTYVDQMLFWQVGLWTAAQTNDTDMYNKYIMAARTSRNLLSRPDGGTHHWAYVKVNDSTTITTQYQGYNDSTTWARGQAWMIHGMADVAKAARLAGDTATAAEFTGYAQSAANFWLSSTNAYAGNLLNGIPVWDFGAYQYVPTHLDRDTSAAAITASGLIDLSQLVSSQADRDRYLDAAKLILNTLSTPKDQGGYLDVNADGSGAGNGILTHGVYVHSYSKATGNSGQFSKSVTDNAAMIWGDYYYLEAIQKYEALPEPATLSLLAVAGTALLRRRPVRRA